MAAHAPGGFESLELLQECGELLLLWWRQVSQSCLFPEHALRKLAAAEERACEAGQSRFSMGPADQPC